MRSYIFTPREREVIRGFLDGKVKLGDDIMRQIAVRLRSYADLGSDVELYLRLRKTIAATSA